MESEKRFYITTSANSLIVRRFPSRFSCSRLFVIRLMDPLRLSGEIVVDDLRCGLFFYKLRVRRRYDFMGK